MSLSHSFRPGRRTPAEPRATGFKESLRRIPSSLFSKSDNTFNSPRRDRSSRRKAFANILHWPTWSETPPPLPVIVKSGVSATTNGGVGASDAIETVLHAHAHSAQTNRKPNNIPRGGWPRSLRSTSSDSAPCQVVPENKPRPSCPPDPFERAESAYPVDSSLASTGPDPYMKHIQAERHIPSITTTVSIDELEPLDESWVESRLNFQVAPFALRPNLSHSSEAAPGGALPARLSSNAPPSRGRSPSNGRSLEITLGPISESVEEDGQALEPTPTLKRERTKPLVWSILRGKGRKLPSAASQDSLRPSTPSNSLRNTPIPSFHITKPSIDTKRSSPIGNATTISAHLEPGGPNNTGHKNGTTSSKRTLPKRKSLSGLFGINLKRSTGRLRSSPRTSPARKVTNHPKSSPRQTSSPFKGRSSTGKRPKPLPKKVLPATIPALESSPPRSVKAHPTWTTPTGLRSRTLVFEDDTSPDTAAFYSRFGNMGFNGTGDGTVPDVTIDDTTCANTQLERFLASMDPGLTTSTHGRPSPSLIPLALKRTISSKALSRASTPEAPEAPEAPRSDQAMIFPSRSPVSHLVKSVRDILTHSAPPSPSPFTSRSPVAFCSGAPNLNGPENEDVPSDKVAIKVTLPEVVVSVEDHDDDFEVVPSEVFHQLVGAPVTPIINIQPLPGLPPMPPSNRQVDRKAHRGQQPPITPDADSLAVSSAEDDGRASFDFTHEVLSLERGDGRKSFIKALHHALSNDTLGSPLREYSPSAKTSKSPSTGRSVRTHRVSHAFEGQPAFQRFVEQTRGAMAAQSSSPTPLTGPPPFALPPPPPMSHRKRGHNRNESGISFASISSLGAPLGGSTLHHDYTNYFETNYTGIGQQLPPLPPLLPLGSMSNYNGAVTRSGGHNGQRSSSVSSLNSLAGAELGYVSGSICYQSRASHYTQHVRQASAASNASSSISISRLSRPTVGERMFDRDENVRLESYVAADDSACWTNGTFESYDASGENEPAEAADSVFGASDENISRSFFIKSRRLSTISIEDSHGPDDTFDGLTHAIEELRAEMGPRGAPQLPSVSRGRAVRKRPEPLKISDYSMDTPGLDTAYTSADDSSLFSFDSSRCSSAPLSAPLSSSFGSFFPPAIATHTRHHSSIATSGIKVDATIPEENSQSTLHSVSPSEIVPSRDNFNYWDAPEPVTSEWLQRQYVAADVCSQNQNVWVSTTKTEQEMLHFRKLSISNEIEKFVAQSKAQFRPLAEAPPGHVVRRRRGSVPHAPEPPSAVPIRPLESRFRNKRNSSEEDDYERPVSALLLEFAREQAPGTVPVTVSVPAPVHAPKHTPSRKTHRSRYSNGSEDFRQSVTNSVRRRKLGWCRRRPSTQSDSFHNSPTKDFKDGEHGWPEVPKHHHEKPPSFFCFANSDDDADFSDTNDSPCPSPSGSPPFPRNSVPRRRNVSVKVSALGSPLNLSKELEPEALTSRRPSNRPSYEPGLSPMRMGPLQFTTSGLGTKPLGAHPPRPILHVASGSQPTLCVLRTSSSPQLKDRTSSRPLSRDRRKPLGIQNENELVHKSAPAGHMYRLPPPPVMQV